MERGVGLDSVVPPAAGRAALRPRADRPADDQPHRQRAEVHAARRRRIGPPRGRTEEASSIEVRDTGPGIPADELPRIFERFYRGTNTGEARASGSGLGLAIVRSIVDMHGGEIDLASAVGEGTVVPHRACRASRRPRKVNETSRARSSCAQSGLRSVTVARPARHRNAGSDRTHDDQTRTDPPIATRPSPSRSSATAPPRQRDPARAWQAAPAWSSRPPQSPQPAACGAASARRPAHRHRGRGRHPVRRPLRRRGHEPRAEPPAAGQRGRAATDASNVSDVRSTSRARSSTRSTRWRPPSSPSSRQRRRPPRQRDRHRLRLHLRRRRLDPHQPPRGRGRRAS